jgi:transposase InsO family protein
VPRWLAAQPDQPTTIAELQLLLDRFTAAYNTRRPHRSLDRRTPLAAYLARPKATPAPATGSTGTEPDTRVRRDRIDTSGVVTLRYHGRLYHIGLGRRHAGTRVLVLARDLHVRVLNTDGELIRELQLDPSRDYQPQARP